jgi:hypothetical protein
MSPVGRTRLMLEDWLEREVYGKISFSDGESVIFYPCTVTCTLDEELNRPVWLSVGFFWDEETNKGFPYGIALELVIDLQEIGPSPE